MYCIVFTTQAKKDAKNISSAGLKSKVQELLTLIESEPLKHPPKFEYLIGALKGKISRRINIQHRLVYEILEEEKTIKILRMWSHYK
jgi:Txe/YoeB family toxin of toxin-antitoxin system